MVPFNQPSCLGGSRHGQEAAPPTPCLPVLIPSPKPLSRVSTWMRTVIGSGNCQRTSQPCLSIALWVRPSPTRTSSALLCHLQEGSHPLSQPTHPQWENPPFRRARSCPDSKHTVAPARCECTLDTTTGIASLRSWNFWKVLWTPEPSVDYQKATTSESETFMNTQSLHQN